MPGEEGGEASMEGEAGVASVLGEDEEGLPEEEDSGDRQGGEEEVSTVAEGVEDEATNIYAATHCTRTKGVDKF